jgi:hypothetical protein
VGDERGCGDGVEDGAGEEVEFGFALFWGGRGGWVVMVVGDDARTGWFEVGLQKGLHAARWKQCHDPELETLRHIITEESEVAVSVMTNNGKT